MNWEDLQEAVAVLRINRALTATEAARAGALVLQKTLAEMYVGEPVALRSVVNTLAAARPEVVSLRNVGVAVLATAEEARVGDRMAAAERSARRLANLLEAVPAAIGRRAQPLLQGVVFTHGCSSAVRSALAQGRARVSVVLIEEPTNAEERRAADRFAADNLPVRIVGREERSTTLAGASLILLGCYAVLADGSAAVEQGSAALARDASARGIPVHIVADTLKLAPWLPAEADRDASIAKIPAGWISKVVTEDGIRQSRQLQAEAADLAKRWHRLDGRMEGVPGMNESMIFKQTRQEE